MWFSSYSCLLYVDVSSRFLAYLGAASARTVLTSDLCQAAVGAVCRLLWGVPPAFSYSKGYYTSVCGAVFGRSVVAPAAEEFFVTVMLFWPLCRCALGSGCPAASNYSFEGFNLWRIYFLVVLGVVFYGMGPAAPSTSLVGGYRCNSRRFCAAPSPLPPGLFVCFPAMLGLIFE